MVVKRRFLCERPFNPCLLYTSYIGELVMDKLREIDDVAYVRFASVYRQFKDVDSFIAEVQQLRKER